MSETKEYKGYTIKINQDVYPESPREWDNLGTMICFHKRYSLGDEHDLSVKQACALAGRVGQITLPLYLYDHSGITMSTTPFSCPWDSGQVGFITVSREKILKEYGAKRLTKALIAKVRSALESEVETYDQYLRGEVYGYWVVNKDGETVDSCFGFYGDPEKSGLLEQAKSFIDNVEGR